MFIESPHGLTTIKTLYGLCVLFDHLQNAFGSGFFLNAGIDHGAVFVDSDNGKTENLLSDGKAASLGGVQGAELDLVAVNVGKAVDVGHQSSAGNAAVAIEVNEDLAGSLKHFGFKSLKELPDIEDIEAAMEGDAPEDELDMQQISIEI